MIKFVFLEELPFRGPQKGQWKNLVATKNDFLRFRLCCWPTRRWKAVCSSARTKAPRIKNTASTSTSWACCFIPSRRTGSLPTATTRRWGMFYSQSWNPNVWKTASLYGIGRWASQRSSNYHVIVLPKLRKCWKPKKNHIVCICSHDDDERSRSEWQRETLRSWKVCSQMLANLCLALKYRPERLLSMRGEIRLKETISASLKLAIKAIYGSPVAGHYH